MTPQTLPLLLVPVSPHLSPLEILKLVGFAMGAALHLYLCWVLYRRYGFRRVERTLLGLGVCIGLWHLGNFAASMYESLHVGFTGGLWWLKGANVIAYVALAFLPPLLAHAHFIVWGWFDERAPRRFFRPLALAGYVPLALLPWVAAKLWSEPYEPPIDKLSTLLLPFIGWLVMIFVECALIDWRLARRQQAARERRFFEVFGATLFGIGLLFLLTYVLGARHWGRFGLYLDLLARLSSVAPTAIVSYYIYRYRYLELVIRQSLVYAALAAVVMMVYVYGIRRFSLFLEAQYELRSDAVEALLILVLIVLAGPLRRLTEGYLHRLLTSEVGLYRELVAQVGDAAAGSGDLAHFIEFAERRLREALELGEVRLIPAEEAEEAAAGALRLAEDRQWKEIDDSAALERLDALACYPLWREGRAVGLLIVRGAPALLTAEKREVLMVLSGHIAVAIENCRLLGEKVKLERELAARERLASLGQMAATVAHEVKNPLSAIKSITQVMREDPEVTREYGRDLDLITGEVDRLNRSVSQLLSFSRPAAVAASSATLGEIVRSVVAIVGAESGGARIEIDLQADPRFSGDRASALKEVALNLALNAVQAVQTGRPDARVRIESEFDAAGKIRLRVGDNGIGIPPAIREKIFDPFFTTKQRGTGLGLAIVARRVRELDGAISVESPIEDGSGTRFEVTLSSEIE
ncbi:MAG: ATP-binding protein [Blastocatellia bacterium]|nr:ATP-binding protein [Blastocatellia bacterium]